MRTKRNEQVKLVFADGTTGTLRYSEVCSVARHRLRDGEHPADVAADTGLSRRSVGAVKANCNR